MKKFSVLLLAASSLLASCQIIPDGPADASSVVSYKALGTEPFWSLAIADGKMKFNHDGVHDVIAPSFEARPGFNGWRYTSTEMSVDVTFQPCSDGMSERTYKDSVVVMIGEQKYEGCGGGVVAPDTLENTTWRIVSIGGTAIGTDRQAQLAFANGRMSGSVGCNQLGGTYSFAGRQLKVGPVMSTKMGCPDPVAVQETGLVGTLGALVSTEFADNGNMVLTGNDGMKVVLEQSI